jgi:hypothetical protein
MERGQRYDLAGVVHHRKGRIHQHGRTLHDPGTYGGYCKAPVRQLRR